MYSDKTTKELREVLGQYQMLTFESQLILNQELTTRNLAVDRSDLELAIGDKLHQIKNLEYLKDFGFNAEFTEDGVIVTRTTKAIIMDVLAIIIGLAVFFIGVYGIGSLVAMFVNGDDFNVFSLAINFAMASLVFNGFKFFNGIKRLIDYSGFRLSNTNGVITLKKRFDLKLEEIKATPSDLQLEEEEEEMVLRLGEELILNSNAENIVQRMTLEELTKVLQKA
ncbi:hypothetical protein [Maribacter sp. R77961]|uniref:hypothetical protein n=1 Tax=Maribacter sp. R77961 TaxID=3093871 RepID=UPI0037C5D791